jgi:hypothetical protein
VSKISSKEPFLLQDRVLLAALCFGSAGYIVIGSWVGIALLIAGFMMGSVWAFRTAGSHPEVRMRLLSTLMLVMLGAFLTVYVATREGVLY